MPSILLPSASADAPPREPSWATRFSSEIRLAEATAGAVHDQHTVFENWLSRLACDLTIGQLRNELAVEHGLDLDLPSQVQLTVRLSLLRSRVSEAIGLSSASLVPLLADLAESSRVELNVGLFTRIVRQSSSIGRAKKQNRDLTCNRPRSRSKFRKPSYSAPKLLLSRLSALTLPSGSDKLAVRSLRLSIRVRRRTLRADSRW